VRLLERITKCRKQESGVKRAPEGDWPLTTLARCMYQAGLKGCLSYWVIDKPEKKWTRTPAFWDRWRAAWVIGSLAFLIVIWAISLDPPLAYVCAGLALWRLFGIFLTGLGTVLNKQTQAHARDLETIGIYAIQLALIFAIVERALPARDFQNTPSSPLDYLYISWTNLTTLGNSYYPQHELAKLTTGLTAASGLFLVGVLLAFGINKVKGD
jgi:hypothetical protein